MKTWNHMLQVIWAKEDWKQAKVLNTNYTVKINKLITNKLKQEATWHHDQRIQGRTKTVCGSQCHPLSSLWSAEAAIWRQRTPMDWIFAYTCFASTAENHTFQFIILVKSWITYKISLHQHTVSTNCSHLCTIDCIIFWSACQSDKCSLALEHNRVSQKDVAMGRSWGLCTCVQVKTIRQRTKTRKSF